MSLFQSTRPRGARLRIDKSLLCLLEFQSTRPRGARRRYREIHLWRKQFQSARPRGARRALFQTRLCDALISIHAPTRGATSNPSPKSSAFVNFNPRAHAGRDRRAAGRCPMRIYFNPRAHAGRDYKWLNRRWISSYFNPRAHAGRDAAKGICRCTRRNFNPRAHAGRDAAMAGNPRHGHISIHAPTRGATFDPLHPMTFLLFQSTRPRGARRRWPPWHMAEQHFNPRAHAGRDNDGWVPINEDTEFQSTRPRGARLGRTLTLQAGGIISIHAPTRGATVSLSADDRPRRHFNPRAHAGRDCFCPLRELYTLYFNPRAHAGRDSRHDVKPSLQTNFNPRAHAGRDDGQGDSEAHGGDFNPRAHAGRDQS